MIRTTHQWKLVQCTHQWKSSKWLCDKFAINKEFDLGTEKSDKQRYGCYCKSSADCPWKINGIKHKEKKL
jgi:hypothetical protein